MEIMTLYLQFSRFLCLEKNLHICFTHPSSLNLAPLPLLLFLAQGRGDAEERGSATSSLRNSHAERITGCLTGYPPW